MSFDEAARRRDFTINAIGWDPLTGQYPSIPSTAARICRISSSLPGSIAHYAFIKAVQINLLLAFFNLIPVPPLDGGNVMLGLLPPRSPRPIRSCASYGFIILYALMLTGIGERPHHAADEIS